MKRAPLKRKSKSDIKKLQDKLWELCKQITRKRYKPTCYTCGATNLEGFNLHTGHMWAKASLSTHLKYDLRILRIQCMRCNCHMGGMGADFYKNMVKEIGKNAMDKLEKERHLLIKADKFWYLKKIEEYENLLNSLSR
jgi:hypothetical protein